MAHSTPAWYKRMHTEQFSEERDDDNQPRQPLVPSFAENRNEKTELPLIKLREGHQRVEDGSDGSDEDVDAYLRKVYLARKQRSEKANSASPPPKTEPEPKLTNPATVAEAAEPQVDFLDADFSKSRTVSSYRGAVSEATTVPEDVTIGPVGQRWRAARHQHSPSPEREGTGPEAMSERKRRAAEKVWKSDPCIV